MSPRTLKFASQKRLKIENAFASKGLTQQNLAEILNLSRSSISKFFNGKSVAYNSFIRICDLLGLDWQDIADSMVSNTDIKESEEEIFQPGIDISSLVNQLRQQVKSDIENRCGTMRILDMTQPIGLSDIYTQVNILETISGRRRKNITELLENCNLEDFERFGLGRVTEEKISAKEAVARHRKLLILGKPGAGKTTFLKHLAIQCNRGEFQEDLVPFFITLKDFAEANSKPELLIYLGKYIRKQNQDNLKKIFSNGKALILLDGLDEVLEADSQRVLKEIQDFYIQFPNNQYVMTCRIAAKEYMFEQFTEVEVADLNWEQIQIFLINWFRNKAIKPKTFLACLEKDERIQELASNPLLLTLLCLAFEESGEFPANRAGLYKEGLDALLKKWDAKRGIKRDEVYHKLWVQRKEDLLSKIAWDTFAPGEYFFKQDKAERYIGEYIRNLPGANVDKESLELDSEVVLRSIESQHGLLIARAKNIYSFSYRAFQEYFTAREIIIVRQSTEEALQELVSYLFEFRWREVFLLAVAMSPNADRLVLLMKEKIDGLVAKDEKTQRFLQWLNEKTRAVDTSFKLEEAQKVQNEINFYVNINLSLCRSLYFSLSLDLDLSLDLSLDLDLDLYLFQTLCFSLYFNLSLNLYFLLSKSLKQAEKCDRKLYQELQKLRDKLPNLENKEKFKQWRQSRATAWIEDLRAIMIKYRNIGHDWQFSDEQKELLEKYYFANQLLTQCLHQECYVSREVRQEIEETLLLPIAEIEKRKGRR